MPNASKRPAASRSKHALVNAFATIAQKQRYAKIRVADIIHEADVGKSTFYDHFKSKDDLFKQSMAGILAVIADSICEPFDQHRLEMVIDHIRENQVMARDLLQSSASVYVIRGLTENVHERLGPLLDRGEWLLELPVEIAAMHIAESQIGLVRGWVQRHCSESTPAIVAALRQTSRSLVNTYLTVHH